MQRPQPEPDPAPKAVETVRIEPTPELLAHLAPPAELLKKHSAIVKQIRDKQGEQDRAWQAVEAIKDELPGRIFTQRKRDFEQACRAGQTDSVKAPDLFEIRAELVKQRQQRAAIAKLVAAEAAELAAPIVADIKARAAAFVADREREEAALEPYGFTPAPTPALRAARWLASNAQELVPEGGLSRPLDVLRGFGISIEEPEA